MEGTDAPYSPPHYDEAVYSSGQPRPAYAEVMERLDGADLEGVAAAVARSLEKRGANFGSGDDQRPFHVDPVPRVIEAAEWHGLAFGMVQRARALNRFIRDAYGDRDIVEAGVVPERVITSADHYEPELVGIDAPGGYAPIVGFDLVRGAEGRFGVLEENLRTPSGLAYCEAAREAVDEAGPFDSPPARRDLATGIEAVGRAIRDAAPDGGGDPSAVLLSDGPSNAAWYEHRVIAERLGVPVVLRDDLEPRSGRLYAAVDGEAPREVQVVYRRTDEDRFSDGRGQPTWLAELLLEPLRAGNVAVVNAPGAGIGDDKLTHSYVDDMIRFYLGQEPILPAVRTYDLGDPEQLEMVLGRLDELVVKPRSGLGGEDVVIGRHVSEEKLAEVERDVRRNPEAYIAQETITLSSHPTVCDGRLEPRHVDLRTFSIAGELVPTALTRVALERGSMIVNSSRGGGAKDTWILA